jgi:DNA-binding NarL/FixJ family response regulator
LKKFRQVGVVHLLSEWAYGQGLTIEVKSPDAPFKKLTNIGHYDMVILDVCGDSLVRPRQQTLMHNVREALPHANLIIVSDREDLEEVCTAFQAGAAGFMPTSIDPAVALEVLSFIRSGGSFFPPSVLSDARSSDHCSDSPPSTEDNPHRMGWHSHGLSERPKLSRQQGHVFKLLQQGLSNKAIARQLDITEATVKVHVRLIMRKFGALNRTQVVLAALNLNTSTSVASGSCDEWGTKA